MYTNWWISLLFQSLKLLRNSEFLPLVVFIKAPELESLRRVHEAAKAAGETEKHVTVRSVHVLDMHLLNHFSLVCVVAIKPEWNIGQRHLMIQCTYAS